MLNLLILCLCIAWSIYSFGELPKRRRVIQINNCMNETSNSINITIQDKYKMKIIEINNRQLIMLM